MYYVNMMLEQQIDMYVCMYIYVCSMYLYVRMLESIMSFSVCI